MFKNILMVTVEREVNGDYRIPSPRAFPWAVPLPGTSQEHVTAEAALCARTLRAPSPPTPGKKARVVISCCNET